MRAFSLLNELSLVSKGKEGSSNTACEGAGQAQQSRGRSGRILRADASSRLTPGRDH